MKKKISFNNLTCATLDRLSITVTAVFLALLAGVIVPPGYAADPLNGVQIFPTDYVWNVPIDKMPILPNSAAMILTQNGPDARIWPTFGYALNVVNSSTARYVKVTTYYWSPSILYSVPKSGMKITNGRADGTCDTSRFDCHAIVVDLDKNIEYDFFKANGKVYSDGSMKVASAAYWPLDDYSLTSDHGMAMAIRSPHLVGQVRYEEIENGVIPHALQMAIPYTRYGYGNYTWPADRSNSIYVKNTSADYPRLGERFRLNASFNASGYSRTNQIIIQAMKTYGMIVVDNGEIRTDRTYSLRGIADSRWDTADLLNLTAIQGSDLEVIDESSLMISPSSGQAKIPGTITTPTASTAIQTLNLLLIDFSQKLMYWIEKLLEKIFGTDMP